MTNLKTVALFCKESGYSEKAVRHKIDRGIWLKGHQYVKAPDGRILIDTEAIERWAKGDKAWGEGQPVAASKSERKVSVFVSPGTEPGTRQR